MTKVLYYQFLQSDKLEGSPSYSLRPEDSDATSNQLILNALVGTLVKFGNSGRIEPYLADAWSTNDEETEWAFQIKMGFSCEDGTPITAESFRRGLLSSLKRNTSKSSKTEFELLKGWQDFIQTSNDSLMEGIIAENNLLIFKFNSRPKSLLNYLRMPYFGFWCESNFPNGKFREDGRFSSSGTYRLVTLMNDEVTLELRESPFKKQGSPEKVLIENVIFEEMNQDLSPRRKIVNVGSSYIPLGTTPEKYEKIQMPPTTLSSIVLKPDGFFKEKKNRHAFATRFYNFLKTQVAIDSGFNFSDGFYLSSPTPKNLYSSETYSNLTSIKVGFPARPQWENSRAFYQNVFRYTLGDAGIKYELIYPAGNSFRTSRDLTQDGEIDIRISGVYPGATYDSSAVKMMFCSNLGANFPDPSGRICSLVESQSPDVDLSQAKFNELLVDDACVLPFAYDGQLFLISKDIDLSSLSKSFIYPRFEDVRFR